MERITTMTLKTYPFDSADYLTTQESQDEFLQITFEDGSPAEIAHALGIIARARGITDLARITGLSRQALYKALSGEGNPEFATIMNKLLIGRPPVERQDAA
jgi:probable addiction module antidote protein